MALTDNLVSYWKLDESSGNATDAHGSNTLTNNGTMSYTAAKINNGASLASTKYLSIADGSQSGLDPGTDMSVSFWFNYTGSVFGINPGVFGKWRASAGNRGYMFNLNGPGPAEQLTLSFRTSSDGTNDTIKSKAGFAVNTVYHVALSYTGSTGTCLLYINGSLSDTWTSMPTSIYDNGQPFEIGSNFGNTIDYWTSGWIDEFGLWNRPITSTEVTSLYNSGSGLAYPFAGSGPANLKSYNTNLKANIKSINTNVIANVKSLNTNA